MSVCKLMSAWCCAGAVAAVAAGCSDEVSNGSAPATPAASTTASAPASTTPAPVAVDPAQFRQGDSYFFHSPSGTFACAILAGPNRPESHLTTGCAGATAPSSPESEQCLRSPGTHLSIGLAADGAQYMCMTDGFDLYVGPKEGEPPTALPWGGGRVLPYGSSLSADGFTCTAREDGITCANDGSKHGFTIARQSDRLF